MTAHVTIALDEVQKAQLDAIAEYRQEPIETVVSSAVRELIEYDAWFRAEVAKGLASIDAGLSIPHEEVLERARRRRLLRELSDR
jgi:predicted transcriptional regulator